VQNFHEQEEEDKEEIYLPRTITILNKKNTILMLTGTSEEEKQHKTKCTFFTTTAQSIS